MPVFKTDFQPPVRLAALAVPNLTKTKQNNQKRSKTDWWGVCDGILGHACPKCLMSSLVFDATNREAVGALRTRNANRTYIDIHTVSENAIWCRHPAEAARVH